MPQINPIDLQKILVIYNSDNAQSLLDAQDYQLRRGLNPEHILGFSFGTLNSLEIRQLSGYNPSTLPPVYVPLCTNVGNYFNRNYYDAVANYILNNGIQGAILSTYTPAMVPTYFSNFSSPVTYSLAGLTSQIVFLYGSGNNNDPINYQTFPNTSAFSYPSLQLNRTVSTYVTLTAEDIIMAGAFNFLSFPLKGGVVKIDNELISYTGTVGIGGTNTGKLTGCTRGYGGTSPATHNVGANIEYYDSSYVQYMLDGVYSPKSTINNANYFTPANWTNSFINQHMQIPTGRLGCPNLGSTCSEATLNPSYGLSTSIYNYAVTKALELEASDNSQKFHVFTRKNNYNNFIIGSMNEAAGNFATSVGMNNTGWTAPSGQTDASQPYFLQVDASPFIDPTIPAIFSLCMGWQSNNLPTAMADLYNKVVPGGWAYTWTSGAFVFGNAFMQNKGAAAIVTAGEPRANAIPPAPLVFANTVRHKLPLMLASFLVPCVHAGYTVIGDPLYTPYKNSVFNWTDVYPDANTMNAYLGSVEAPSWVNISPSTDPNWTIIGG